MKNLDKSYRIEEIVVNLFHDENIGIALAFFSRAMQSIVETKTKSYYPWLAPRVQYKIEEILVSYGYGDRKVATLTSLDDFFSTAASKPLDTEIRISEKEVQMLSEIQSVISSDVTFIQSQKKYWVVRELSVEQASQYHQCSQCRDS